MDELAVKQFLDLEQNHWWFQGRRQVLFSVLDHELPRQADLQILDVGCGAGGMIGNLRKYGRVRGVDVDENLAAVCRERGFMDVVVTDGKRLPGEDGEFDLVTYFDCLEHIEDDVRELQEAYRVVTSGGYVFASVPAFQFLYAGNDVIVHHQRRYTAGMLARKLQAAGFELVRCSYFNSILFPVILPAVLLIKVKERLQKGVPTRTNLSYRLPVWMNRALSSVFSSEKHLIRRWDLPLGHSLCVLARKP